MTFELKPIKQIPKIERGVRKSEYDEILDKFLEAETKYAEISKEGVKTISLASALRNRITSRKLDKKIKVRQVSKKVYLEKI